jgi:hypothetical protein
MSNRQSRLKKRPMNGRDRLDELGGNLMSRKKNMSRNFSTRLFLRISQQNSGSDSDYSHVCFLNFLSVSCRKNCFVRKFFFCYGRKINYRNTSKFALCGRRRGGGWMWSGWEGKERAREGGGGEGVCRIKICDRPTHSPTRPSHQSHIRSVSMIDDGSECACCCWFFIIVKWVFFFC